MNNLGKMNKSKSVEVEEFSDSYFLVTGIDVEEYSGYNVGADDNLFGFLNTYTLRPLMKIGDQHRWLWPEWGVPAETVAIPKDLNYEDQEVLLAKSRTVETLHQNGVVDDP